MNYIWDLVITAERAGLTRKEINFAVAEVYSPYMELSNETLNSTMIEERVEINPYYRFYEIFRDMFNINNTEDSEFRNTLFDLLIHLLTEIDLMQGMGKREYYIMFILRDMEAGIFGHSVQTKLKLFSKEEQEGIASNLLRLYETGEAVYLFKDTMRKIFHHSTIYANCEEKDELLIYIGQEENEKAWSKIELIKELFLPVRFHTELYWGYHFGIMNVEETMRIDLIALY